MDDAPPGGIAQVYMLELLARQPIAVDTAAILAAARVRLGDVELRGASPLLFTAKAIPVPLRDATVCPQFALLPGARAEDAAYHDALWQSWRCREARSLFTACTHSLRFTDLFSAPLPYLERVRFLRHAISAVLAHAPADLIYWQPTQQFLTPAQVCEAFDAEHPLHDPLFGFVNVRFFRLPDTDAMVMDTLGLAALGLPDLQCHYRDLDPSLLAWCLYSLAAYVFEHGDVIEDGHTVQGIAPDDRWRCRHETALLAPTRMVLDLDPGAPFAAGQREA
jgi:hypothetical protein